jgi:hypothetical protein
MTFKRKPGNIKVEIVYGELTRTLVNDTRQARCFGPNTNYFRISWKTFHVNQSIMKLILFLLALIP